MKDFLAELKRVPLFEGVDGADILKMLDCLGASVRSYDRGEAVLRAGDSADRVGAVLTGGVLVSREDADGNRTVLTDIPAGGLFAEAYACARAAELPVSVHAARPCAVLFLDCGRVLRTCPAACPFHARLISNLLAVLAEKNVFLTRRLEHLSKRSLREKLLSYLSEQEAGRGGGAFTIPFDRQELADYLCADRSALSRELGRLRAEGLLEVSKNKFRFTSQCGMIYP